MLVFRGGFVSIMDHDIDMAAPPTPYPVLHCLEEADRPRFMGDETRVLRLRLSPVDEARQPASARQRPYSQGPGPSNTGGKD